MAYDTKHFTVADPRTFEGDPFEVAERAVAQLQGIATILSDAIGPARLMARNAELERQCQRDEQVDAPSWPDTAEGRRWQAVDDKLLAVRNDLNLLVRVASFNPKSPLGKA